MSQAPQPITHNPAVLRWRDRWLLFYIGATYEYVPSGSHFGLVMGSRTWPQVAQSVFGWLEERRHAMAAATAALTAAGARR